MSAVSNRQRHVERSMHPSAVSNRKYSYARRTAASAIAFNPLHQGRRSWEESSDSERDVLSETNSEEDQWSFLSGLDDIELQFNDDGHKLKAAEEDPDGDPYLAVTLDDVKSSLREPGASSDSLDKMLIKRKHKSKSRMPSLADMGGEWVGIPPLYHQTNLTIPTWSIPMKSKFAPSLDCSAVAWRNDTLQNWHVDHKQGVQAEKTWTDMPTHLLPFVPFIEKTRSGVDEGCRIYTSKNMDIQVILTWLRCCQDLHGSKCCNEHRSSTTTKSETFPSYLIDVKEGYVVEAPQNARYLALSYVWGKGHESAFASNANIDTLRSPGGLYRGTMSLPRTILDTIHLVHRLGETYLWVDRLCIIQDESDTKQAQLQAMGIIYANALLTVVAAQNEDASLSLFGERKLMYSHTFLGSEGNHRTPHQSALNDKQIMLRQSMSLMRTKWFSRAWTFQEYLFSRRRIVFHNDTMNWECLCAAWHEGQDMKWQSRPSQRLGAIDVRELNAQMSLSRLSFWPDMLRYTRLMTLFNERALTFPEDVLDAFAGCLKPLSLVFPGGFITGLPVMCFDAALLWQPWTCMERRQSRRRDDACLPSWSWAGWEGIINSESWRSTSIHQFERENGIELHQQCSWITTSTVRWSWSEALTSECRAINVPEPFIDPRKPHDEGNMPAGWRSVKLIGETGGRYCHSHDDLQKFRRPFPLSESQSSEGVVVSARYLHCNTYRAFLKLGKVFESSICDCPTVELTTSFGRWAGVLRLNCLPNGAGPYLNKYRRRNGGRCELIELSEGSVSDQEVDAKSFDEWHRWNCPRSNGRYDFINVLWIEWVNNVAYRKALGRVKKDVWRREAKVKAEIILG